jgi:glycerol-1-phosphate dehydrogenase [NAD(P)+]
MKGESATAHNGTVYGEDVLAGEVNRLGNYVVVTDEVPWRLYQDRFPRQPVAVLMPDTLERFALDAMVPAIPEGATIVGLGGGSVIDMAKYFAYLRGETPVLVPTITSSNAQFSDFISVRRGGSPAGFKEEGLPRHVIVDFALIQMAEPRLNRAGYGDVLCMQTTLNDWRLAAAAGRVKPEDPVLEKAIMEMVRQAVESAAQIGPVSRRGIETLMKLLEDSTALVMANLSEPITAGSEHLFAWNLERITGRHFIHGEIVSLGIVICSYLQGSHHAELRNALEEAQVMYRPDELGIGWEEVEQTLLTVGEYNRRVRKFSTVFDEVDWTPRLLEEVRGMI